MSSSQSKGMFKSSLAPLMEQFVQEKRAVGYRYETGAATLIRLDRFLANEAPPDTGWSRSVIRRWLAKRPLESTSSQRTRFTVARQFAEFLCRLGHPVYVPDRALAARGHSSFSPRIFTQPEIRRLLQEADRLTPLQHAHRSGTWSCQRCSACCAAAAFGSVRS